MAKSKRAKKKRADVMMPNLSGTTFKDALTALLKTAPPDQKKKP